MSFKGLTSKGLGGICTDNRTDMQPWQETSHLQRPPNAREVAAAGKFNQ